MDISVIIPTLNEAERIAGAIESVRQQGECEILVVDGGSTDETMATAHSADACLVTSCGRAVQQNSGAAMARGDVFLFLHADCHLLPGGFEAIREALLDERTVGGCFRQSIDAPGLKYRLLEMGNALRVHCWKWAYGDQGIFVRRETFEQIGGFPDLELMEDLFLMKRLKRAGRFQLLKAAIKVSPRRWVNSGVVFQTLRNWTWLTLVQCGLSPNRLAKKYLQVR